MGVVMADTKLISLTTELDNSKTYDEQDWEITSPLLVYEDVLEMAQRLTHNLDGEFTIKLHRNHDGYPTAVTKKDGELFSILGIAKSNSHPYRLEKTEGSF